MTDTRIENLNIDREEALITPAQLKTQYPLSETAIETVMFAQKTIKHILSRTDPRLLAVVGPCSIHDIQAAKEYASKLKKLAHEVQDSLFVVMRVYFEKPRTRVGWQGLINDPYLDGSCKIEDGLKLARELLLHLAEIGLPTAGEALDLVTPQYVQDLISWTAIGARTTESQSHRKMASGLSCVVGFKNGTDGNLTTAINAIYSAAHSNNFVSVDPEGKIAVIRTKGNPNTHVVLRGGNQGPNYDADHIAQYESALKQADLPENIMIDCSHDNSQKDPEKQLEVIENVIQQIEQKNHSIMGLMIESNLVGGNQSIPENLKNLRYGVSVTDACIGWEATENALNLIRNRLADILPSRGKH